MSNTSDVYNNLILHLDEFVVLLVRSSVCGVIELDRGPGSVRDPQRCADRVKFRNATSHHIAERTSNVRSLLFLKSKNKYMYIYREIA